MGSVRVFLPHSKPYLKPLHWTPLFTSVTHYKSYCTIGNRFNLPFVVNIIILHYMSLLSKATYILWVIPTGAIWGEVSCPRTQRLADCSGTQTSHLLIRSSAHYPLSYSLPMIRTIILKPNSSNNLLII